jgi:hypothetical protein
MTSAAARSSKRESMVAGQPAVFPDHCPAVPVAVTLRERRGGSARPAEPSCFTVAKATRGASVARSHTADMGCSAFGKTRAYADRTFGCFAIRLRLARCATLAGSTALVAQSWMRISAGYHVNRALITGTRPQPGGRAFAPAPLGRV